MMTEDRLKEIEERAAAATPGPWKSDEDCPLVYFGGGIDGLVADCHCITDDPEERAQAEVDAAFIAAARDDVPDLVAEVRKVRWLFADFQKQIEEMQACIDAAGKALIGDGVISDLYAVGDALESYYSVRDAGVLPTSEAVLSGRTSRDDELSKLRAILTELVDLWNTAAITPRWASGSPHPMGERVHPAWDAAREALGREG